MTDEQGIPIANATISVSGINHGVKTGTVRARPWWGTHLHVNMAQGIWPRSFPSFRTRVGKGGSKVSIPGNRGHLGQKGMDEDSQPRLKDYS